MSSLGNIIIGDRYKVFEYQLYLQNYRLVTLNDYLNLTQSPKCFPLGVEALVTCAQLPAICRYIHSSRMYSQKG